MSSGKCCYSCGFGGATATPTEIKTGVALLGRHDVLRMARSMGVKRRRDK